MKLEFHSLDLHSFKSFDKDGIYLKVPGLTFVRGWNEREPRLGSNGAGKSTLFDALCWCLYGKTPDGLHNTDVKPWRKKAASPWATVVITRDDKAHEIERDTVKGLFLDRNKVDQEAVDRLLGMSFETFTNTVLLGQGQPLFFDRTPTEKMNLFAAVLDLGRFDDYSKKAAETVKKLEDGVRKRQRDYDELNGKCAAVEDSIKGLEVSAKRWDAENAEADKDEIAKLEMRVAVLIERRDRADLSFDSAETELRDLRKKLLTTASDLTRAQRAWDKIDLELKRLQDDISVTIQADRDKECPLCFQPLKTKEAKTRISGKIAAIRKRVKEGIPKEVDKQLSLAKAAQHHTEQHIRDFEDKANKATDELETVRPQIAELQGKLNALKDRGENPYRTQLSVAKRTLKEAEKTLRDIDAELEKAKEAIERVRFWVKGFRDIRLYVLEEVLDELEMHTNSMLEEVGLIGWEVLYEIEKETKAGTISRGLTVSILSPRNDDPVRWENWSGGEAQRLRLIGALALSEVLLNYAGVQPSLEILDEPSASLSEEGIDDLIDYLSDRARSTGKSVFYVDHRVVETNQFDNVIMVVKDKQGSFVDVA